jgi:hypothetical protein
VQNQDPVFCLPRPKLTKTKTDYISTVTYKKNKEVKKTKTKKNKTKKQHNNKKHSYNSYMFYYYDSNYYNQILISDTLGQAYPYLSLSLTLIYLCIYMYIVDPKTGLPIFFKSSYLIQFYYLEC